MERSSKTTQNKNLNLLVFQHIAHGLRPSKICEILDIKKTALQYYLSSLKRAGMIKKIGYGVWEITGEFDKNKFKKTTQVARGTPCKQFELLSQDSVRAHAFQFKIKLPEIQGWNDREKILIKKDIKFFNLKIGGGGQSILFRDTRIWLTNRSVIIYKRSSYLAQKAKDGRSHAIYDLMILLRGLERLLGVNLKIRGDYSFKVSRQHYALVKNALAKQYDNEGKKLEIYTGNGLWFLIDNSYNLHEAETVHPETAVVDNERVQDFFNSLKETKGYTPQFVVNAIAQNTRNLDHYAVHLKSHVKSVQALDTGVASMVSEIKKLSEIIKELKK